MQLCVFTCEQLYITIQYTYVTIYCVIYIKYNIIIIIINNMYINYKLEL